jgi:hypothetical protein
MHVDPKMSLDERFGIPGQNAGSNFSSQIIEQQFSLKCVRNRIPHLGGAEPHSGGNALCRKITFERRRVFVSNNTVRIMR